MSEIFIIVSFFAMIFGIAYLYFTSRNRERMALIEKGADASIFVKGKRQTAPFWKVLVLNLALVLMGIGLGIFIGAFAHNGVGLPEEIAFPGAIFLTAGLGLFIGFNLTKKLDKE